MENYQNKSLVKRKAACLGNVFLVWRGSNQSERCPCVLQPVAQLPNVECGPQVDAQEQDTGVDPGRAFGNANDSLSLYHSN